MGSTNRLLIVDDEPAITRLIELTARQLGAQVTSIHNSDEFEAALESLQPSIIFLDIAMPGRDGMELLEYLRASNYRGRIVIMSGSDERYMQMTSTVAKVRGLMVAGTLAKPFRKQQVMDLLGHAAQTTDEEQSKCLPLGTGATS